MANIIVPDGVQSGFKLASILDTDLYKFTMQQAIFEYYPTAQVVYRFTHRDKDRQFSRTCIEKFKESLSSFAEVQLRQDERAWLQDTCKYFKPAYLDYLQSYRFKPEQVSVNFIPSSNDPDMGSVKIEARGSWLETVLWEVPLMACLCEMYFRYADQDWDYASQEEQAMHKAKCLLDARCKFSEFGTRRRRSFVTQDLVLKGIMKARDAHDWKEGFFATSNVYFAMRYNLNPIGTIAHEWFMGIAALCDYKDATGTALDLWSDLYGENLSVTLTDTFSTEVFYRVRSRNSMANAPNQWKFLRQDSGDPKVFAPRAKQMYEERGIDYTQKGIIFSDALNYNRAKELNEQCQQLGLQCSFGIGTWLTNDFKKKSSQYTEQSKALNIVIKLGSIDGKECVKISDEITKNTGVPEVVAKVKETYQIRLSTTNRRLD
ncbi:Quinolinate phosphoribosyl transferase [Suillus paluster]|uniref:Quinolinate phosphoribosyl transferase n=1 Tax=Suillus paluster TaxID=48578 RepID=UPI001B8638B7|nr:Quinolinate phosphoribosyl transferase [Suillus paluster]KAG1725349.1 Quinolinate phosphoribosyl transferase [Suillus paluster]